VRVLVTGSAGFIGKHTVTALTEAGHEVFGVDKREGGGDILDLANPVEAAFAFESTPGLSAVVHLAATCSTPGSLNDPLGTYRDTVTTAVNVLEGARRADVPVILVSSVKARDGKTPYGAAKRMVEVWAKEYRDAFGSYVAIVRPGTVYGRGQEGSPESGWVAWFLKAKLEDHPVVISGDGSQTRDVLHVSDLTRLFTKMVEDPRSYLGQTWDVGGGLKNAVTVQQMADFIGLDYTFGPPRYGDVASYIGKNDAPGWEPEVEWRNGIGRLL